jgi:lysophospholipase L1-like esterase
MHKMRLATLVAGGLLAGAAGHSADGQTTHWVRSWAAPMMAPEEFGDYPDLGRVFRGATIRQVVDLTIGGRTMRVWISNEFGIRPLVIGAAHVAKAAGGAAIAPGSDRELYFDGNPGITVPPGAAVVSDTVALDGAPGISLAISLFLPNSTEGSPSSVHEEQWRRAYVSVSGNHAASISLPVSAELHSTYFMTGVDVEVPISTAAIVAFGDSITDGTGSTPGAGRSWPEQLSRRLVKKYPDAFAVLNMGIGGNRLLHDATGPAALARVNRDVFAVPGVRFLIVLEGINDIGGAEWFSRPEEDVSAEDLIAAFRQIIDRAHEHGIRVLGATITPSGGCAYAGYDSSRSEAKRIKVNAWIRDSHAFDAVLDFDRVIRDPQTPSRMRPEFDSGDHLHPGDAGYAAMAESIDLGVFAAR